MSLEELITRVFVWVDDSLRAVLAGRPVRRRGPRPALADSEVIAVELVGEWLGLDRDAEIFWHFRQHHAGLFPALAAVHRTTFARQAANLWRLKQLLHERLVSELAPAAELWLVDSVPIPVCAFGRGGFCKRFRGQAGFGYDHARRQTFLGFRLHVRTTLEGLVLAFALAPAPVADAPMVAELHPLAGSTGVGDRNYWSPETQGELRGGGVALLAPFRAKSREPRPERAALLGRLRWRVETALGQLCEQFALRRTWARDLWHLCHRVTRKVLGHTLLVKLCRQQGLPSLQFAQLLD